MASEPTYRGVFFLCLVLDFLMHESQGKKDLLIGAIFPCVRSIEEGALRFAIDRINADPNVLPNYEIKYIGNSTDSMLADFQNIQKVCYQLSEGVTTIIGPMTSSTVKASHPMCIGLHVPMIAPSATDPMLENKNNYRYLLRMAPTDSLQSEALVEFIKYFRWDTMAILTDNTDYGINGMMAFQTLAAENKWRVLSVQQFVAALNVSNVNAREQLVNIRGTGARIILLNCLAEYAVPVLNQASNAGMVQGGWVWIVTDGVSGMSVLPDLVVNHPEWVGLVGTRPLTTNGSLYEEVLAAWNIADSAYYYSAGNGSDIHVAPNEIVREKPISWPLLYYDSLMVYASAMHKLLEVDGHMLNTSSLSCTKIPAQPWSMGAMVMDYLLKVSTEGVTGKLEFDENGSPRRENSAYDIVLLTEDGWKEFGRWSDPRGLQLNISGRTGLGMRPFPEIRDYVGDLLNKTLRVVTVIDHPFVFKRGPNDKVSEGSAPCTGNDCFEGYAIDLLEKMASDLGFNYVIHDVPDGLYGSYDAVTGRWNGMVGELIPDENGDMKADLAIGAFTITSERQKVISFTKPYRDLQLGILLGTPADEQYDPWSFLIPLTYDLWGLTLGTAFVVAIVITILDKLSPYGHHGRKAQIDNDTEHEAMDKNDDGTVDYWEQKEWRNEKHAMSVTNAILWSLASLFEQGGERHPKSWSARIVAGAWWVGALIIVQSYTANLAAFLTIKSTGEEINAVEDLAHQTAIQYGTVRESQVQDFFNTALRSPYKEMGDQMRKWDTFFDNTTIAANYTESLNGTFALIYDMPSVTYWKGQSCRFRLVPNGFSNVGYGLGLPLGSVYAEELTIKIYNLREAGFTDTLDDKWIARTATCVQSGAGELQEETVQIGMPSLWGVFWIIYGGFAVSALVLVVEWIVSAVAYVDPTGVKGPKSVWEVVKLRFRLFKEDVAENWFMINFRKAEVRRLESRLRPQTSSRQPEGSQASARGQNTNSKVGIDNFAYS